MATRVSKKRESVYHSSLSASWNATSHAEDSLEWIIGNLKSYIHDFDFCFHEFGRHSEDLGSNLENLSGWIHIVFPQNKELLMKLEFAKNLYNSLSSTAKKIQFYTFESMDQHLVHDLLLMNVSVLKLYDSKGVPDPKLKDYVERL